MFEDVESMQLLTSISLCLSIGATTSCSNSPTASAKRPVSVATKANEGLINVDLQKGSQSSALVGVEAFERRIAENIERSRKAAGLSPMAYHSGIAKLARNHSRYLSKKNARTGKRVLNHDGVKGRFNKLLLNYSMSKVAENVIVTSGNFKDNAGKISTVWMNSPKHKENILKEWNYTGIGVSVGPDGIMYATQIFALKTNFTF